MKTDSRAASAKSCPNKCENEKVDIGRSSA
jgi:hypothetical protein